MAENAPYVARASDLSALSAHWEAAKGGSPRFLRMQAPFGGGKRAIASELLRSIQASGEDALLWRVVCVDQEDGIQWLIRMYGALVSSLGADVLRRGRVEMILNAQLPAQPKRVQGWYQQFVSSMKDAKTDTAKQAVQLRLPQDNPLIGLVEVVVAIARKMPIVLDLQNAHVVNSVILAEFLEAVASEAKDSSCKILAIVHDEAPSDVTRALWPMPLVDLFDRRGDLFQTLALGAWGAEEVGLFLASKGVTGNAARIAEIAGGRPGFIAELVDILQANGQIDGALDGVTFSSLLPIAVDEDELGKPVAQEEGKRKHAHLEDVENVLFFAALLGQAFPANLVADLGGYERDSIDDLLDAMPATFEEVQFSEELQTWIYKFIRGSWREGVIERNRAEDRQQLAVRVGQFIEQFLVPRGAGYIPKCAKIYAENGAPNRANVMRAIALSNDNPDTWALSHDLIRYFDEVKWPEALRRTVFTNLLDRMVANGPVPNAEKLLEEVSAFAKSLSDADLSAWVTFSGSKLDARRQDWYRARQRGEEALAAYRAIGSKMRAADVLNHLAGVELQENNDETALKLAEQAVLESLEDGPDGQKIVPPGVFALSEHVRGAVARKRRQFEEAAKHFGQSNDVAGRTGLSALALDSGLALGETLLASSGGDAQKTGEARDVLQRVVQIAQQLRNPVRERGATELLAQAEGALRNFDAALAAASRTLQLSRALKFERLLPIDLYNVGFFHFAKDKHVEALTFFNEAEKGAPQLGNHPFTKELYYFKGLAEFRTGAVDAARVTLVNGLNAAAKFNDVPKVISTHDILAQIAEKQGDVTSAKRHLSEAIELAQRIDNKDARRTLRKKLDALEAGV